MSMCLRKQNLKLSGGENADDPELLLDLSSEKLCPQSARCAVFISWLDRWGGEVSWRRATVGVHTGLRWEARAKQQFMKFCRYLVCGSCPKEGFRNRDRGCSVQGSQASPASLQPRKCSLPIVEDASWTVVDPGLVSTSEEPPQDYPGTTYLFLCQMVSSCLSFSSCPLNFLIGDSVSLLTVGSLAPSFSFPCNRSFNLHRNCPFLDLCYSSSVSFPIPPITFVSPSRWS